MAIFKAEGGKKEQVLATYRQFLFSLKAEAAKALKESGLSLNEVSRRTKIKEEKLVSIFYGKANFRINDLLNIARALEMRVLFALKDVSGVEYLKDSEATLLYSDCSQATIEGRKNKLKNQIAASSSEEAKRQFSLALERLEKANCNNPMQRYLIYRKVSLALCELCIDRLEMADLLNVSMVYLERLENGEANFSMELLYRLSAVTKTEWEISFSSWRLEANIG